MPVLETDTIGALTGGAGAALKAARPTVWPALEASHAALLGPEAIPDVTPLERLLVALAIATWHADEAAAGFYAEAAAGEGASPAAIAAAREGRAEPVRLSAMLVQARKLTFAPAETTAADLAALRKAGISEDGIISLSQLIAYLSHQLRAAYMLRLIGA